MRINTFLFGVLLLVNGVFDVDADEVSVSVMVRDSVTLHTDVAEILMDTRIIWKFGNEIIAKMNKADGGNAFTYDGPGAIFKDRLKLDKQTGSLTITNIGTEHIGHYSVDIKSTDAKLKTFQVTVRVLIVKSCSKCKLTNIGTGHGLKQVNGLNNPDDAKWRNIRLNDKTRDLVISNIRSDQSGLYKMEINTISMVLHRKFLIAVGDEMTTVSGKEGESVTLRTGLVDRQGYDLILWKCKDHILAKIDRTYTSLPKNSAFEDRLDLNENTGSLKISDYRITDCRVYHLNMSNSAYTLQRTISVIVKDPPQSGAASGICGAGVGLVVWVVTAFFAARFVDNQGKIKSRDLGSLTPAHHNYPESLLSFTLDAVRRDISMRNNSFLFWLLLFADVVFAADEVTVSVMVGDSVTLRTDDTEAQELVWKIQGENKFIAEIDKEINTLSIPGNDEERFRGRLELDGETGSLTITNLKTTDSRVYELQIKNSKETKSKIFNVAVSDEMKTVLVKKEESIILRTGATDILGYDLILWKFEDHLLAKINRTATQFSVYDNAGGRFSGRLQLHHQTGSLIISDTRTTDSGDYHLNMSSSSHSLQRTISVTVKGLSSVVIAVISVSLALVVAVALVIYCWCRSRQSRDTV